MVLLDDRGHSPALLPYFHPYSVEVEPAYLDAADLFFCGNGPSGSATIGIERKRIADLTGSIRSERLSGFQVDGLLEYDFPMILVEGIYRAGKTGELETLQGSGFKPHYVGQRLVYYSEVSNFLMTFELACGLSVVRTGSPEETAAFTIGLYQWFQKDWDSHKAHLGIYAPVPEHPNFAGGHKLRLLQRPKASLVVKMAAQLDGIDQKAWKVGEHFKTPAQMIMASELEWKTIDGIGAKGARKIVEALQQ